MTQAAKTQTTPAKRLVFTMGGEGGVGKTGVMVALAEWFAANEMLRILEAMGILALLTRHPPKDIADERERIQAMLDAHLQFSDEAQEQMLGYVHFIESRPAEIPPEIEVGLDPQQIAKILGESLRQHFVSSGVPETVAGLQATSTAMGNMQKQLIGALRDLTDREGGVAARVENANRQFCRQSNAESRPWMNWYTNSNQTCSVSGFR